MMRARAYLCAAMLFGAALAAASDARAQTAKDQGGPTRATTVEMTLIVGENKTIPAQGVTSYSVGAGGIVDVKVAPGLSQFVFVGARPGSTTVLMLMQNGTQVTYAITVYARSPEQVQQEVEQLLVGYTGLRLRKVGTRFFIEGGVATDGDARRIALIASLYPGQVESLVVVGSVGIEHTINIRIDFYFVQYDKTSTYGAGVRWPGAVGPGGLVITRDLVANATNATATLDQALPALDLAQTRGWAKVLKHSTVVTTSGSEATFENGGEQNFPVSAGLTGTVQAIKFGTNMTVVPRYDSVTRDLEVKVNAFVSDLTPPAAGSLPGRKTSTVNTFVHLKLGQSIVLSGIRSSSTTHSVSGIPLLSQIPVLGLLFGSHQNSEAEIEGAVFIIPSIVESVPRKAYDIVDAAMKQYDDYSGNLDSVNAYSKPPPNYK
ncbi:type II and III secretion system protein [Pendulispora rubella]|uniref:Type II and III secretion system protein n=1 Tax=Pendulispora rubella TaxID=2741070 RepID=A0ABZ2L8Q0_9BACT